MKLLILFIISFNLPAQTLTPLEKGQPAPYSGHLADKKAMENFRTTNEENKLLKQKEMKLEELQIIKDEKIKYYQTESEFFQKELRKEKVSGNFKGIGGFIIGVVATGVAAWAAIQVTK